MARSKKQGPATAAPRLDSKQVRAAEITGDHKPAWRFSTVDRSGCFAWPVGEPVELVILDKLRQFDSMEWREIEGSEHHSISVEQLSKAAQQRLAVIGMDDIEAVFSFRLQGRERVFCIRDRSLAKLLWYDPDHQVCPSIKKHT